MSHAFSKGVATAFAIAPWPGAGGAKDIGAPGPINVFRCFGARRDTRGIPARFPLVPRLRAGRRHARGPATHDL